MKILIFARCLNWITLFTLKVNVKNSFVNEMKVLKENRQDQLKMLSMLTRTHWHRVNLNSSCLRNLSLTTKRSLKRKLKFLKKITRWNWIEHLTLFFWQNSLINWLVDFVHLFLFFQVSDIRFRLNPVPVNVTFTLIYFLALPLDVTIFKWTLIFVLNPVDVSALFDASFPPLTCPEKSN